jgi:protein-L-isoaspartate O-methyltransferase
MLQAAFSDQGRAAEIAWAVGVAWQGQGIASEAARAVVGWLERRGVATITAHIHPDHHASATVATRAGLRPTGEYRDHEGISEQLWRRRVEALPHSAHPPAKQQSMPTAHGDPVRERLAGYATALHGKGAIRSQAVQRAFASVRRDRCLTRFYTPDGTVDVPQDSVPSAAVLDRVYSDQALVTLVDERGAPASSSSQPALVAEMLEALELAPGMRVLEVGAGTGYNAALLATITAAPVVAMDTNQQVVEEARAALDRLGLDGQVTVIHGDGYDGWPAAAPYDRIIVTCGCAGLSPRWLAQLPAAPGRGNSLGLPAVPRQDHLLGAHGRRHHCPPGPYHLSRQRPRSRQPVPGRPQRHLATTSTIAGRPALHRVQHPVDVPSRQVRAGNRLRHPAKPRPRARHPQRRAPPGPPSRWLASLRPSTPGLPLDIAVVVGPANDRKGWS